MELSTSPGGRRTRSRDEIRAALVAAAIEEFSRHGFDGASTRAIAGRAAAHQPQINYHFDSKESLWKAAVECLLGELDALLAPTFDQSLLDGMEAAIRALVEFSARRPELNRMMIHEGTSPSGRLEWLVETHLRPRSVPLRTAWTHLVADGVAAPVPVELVYHLMIGASSLLHANAPEARLLFGIEPTDDEVVAAHANALVDMFLPGR